ncbi:DUF389 domain-containing protein [Leifsonia sp. RAF41]|uniref:DUF389 domain-containing protein n=1 Tax=Leifsonia sp. RAF41 TaxID=3233056 RepID=UPI003F99232D
MQHLRIIAPADLVDQVLTTLQDNVATTNIVRIPKAATRPAGDLVLCDVAREGLSALLDQLQQLGVQHEGSISVDDIGIEISDAAKRASRAAPGHAADAVVWQEIEQRTHEETSLSPTFLTFMSVATMIAAIGVVFDEPILIVGAMVVGPDFGPLAALSVGLVRWRRRMIAQSVLALAVGFAIAIAITILFTLLLTALHLMSPADLLHSRPLTDFIWRPNVLSWVVGFLAGIAGLLSLSTAKSGALIGVLISVTTIPAAANAAVALAYGATEQAVGALIQLVINLAAITLGGVATLIVQRVNQRRHAAQAITGRQHGPV